MRKTTSSVLFFTLLTSILTVTITENAFAEVPSYQIERMNPASGAADYIDIASPVVVDNLDFSAGGYFSYASGPLVLPAGNKLGSQVRNQLTASVVASMGFFNFMEVGVLFPFTLYQDSGSDEGLLGLAGVQDPKLDSLPRTAMNDPRISLKFQILNTLTSPVGLGILLNTYVPIGLKKSLTADGGVSIEGLLLAEYNIYRNIRIAANLGYRWRQLSSPFTTRFDLKDELVWGLGLSVPVWSSSFDFLLEFEGSVNFGKNHSTAKGLRPPEVPAEARVAARWGIMRHLTLTAGFGTSLNRGSDHTGGGIGSPDVRVFFGLDGRWVMTNRFTDDIDYDADNLRGIEDQCPELAEDYDGFQDDDGCPDYDNDGDGVDDVNDKCPGTPDGINVGPDGCPLGDTDGDGIQDSEDRCPNEAEDLDGFQDDDGCPDPDNDGDGIPDTEDTCPDDKEDKDGFQDGDGCPEPDNDGDGIPDNMDKCPNDPETFNSFVDDDGCPDDPSKRVQVGGDSLIITDQIFFNSGRSTIQRRSLSILDDIAKVLNDNKQIELMRIEGNTDNRGKAEKNLKLSQTRAEAVRKYLIDKGIDGSRLVAIGYGETKPIDDNETEAGRSRNRRVDFKILKVKKP